VLQTYGWSLRGLSSASDDTSANADKDDNSAADAQTAGMLFISSSHFFLWIYAHFCLHPVFIASLKLF